MSDTFESVWRRARLEMPAVPPLLVRSWAQEAYSQACDSWDWSFLRAESAITTRAARSIAVSVVQGSATVTSAGLFVATDAGRQLRIGNTPIYTIKAFVDVNTVTLDLVYSRDTNAAATAQILDAYTVMPTDFARFMLVTDPYNQRAIVFDYTADQLALTDIARTNSDSGPRALVSRTYSTATATLGQVRYEFWPYPTAARSYPYLYYRGPEELADATVLPGPLASRGDALKSYVLSRGAMWPGTVDQKNPFFSPATAKLLRAEWDQALQDLSLIDDNIYPQQAWTVDWFKYGGMSTPSSLLRQTDATVADYY